MTKFVSCIALTALTSALCGQNLLLPDNHYLGESATQLQSSGSLNWWGTTVAGRRMMVLYDASHFTGKAGALGPIDITHLKFRGEDTEKNTGGQTYTGVTVSIYKTTLNSVNLPTGGSTTVFGTNIAPPVGNTTTLMRTATIPLVTVAPSLGTGPNNFMIDLDISSSPILASFNPLSDAAGEFNLLVDIAWTGYTAGPAIPPSATLIPMIATQDTTAHGAGIRGRGIYATTPAATSGTASTAPPVMGVEFAGGGGYATLIPATTEYYGASCGGSPSTYYQAFAHNQPFDLAGSGITMVPDVAPPAAPNFYTVLPGAPAVDPTKVNAVANSTADDAVLVATPMGFSAAFKFPGGSTTSIRPSTNGFVWMDPAMAASDATPTVLEWLGNTATTPYTTRFAPFWHDFDGGENLVTHPGSGLHVFTDTLGGPGNAVCYVTWLNTGEFNTVTGGGQSVNTMQCVFHEISGIVEFRYGAMSRIDGGSIANPLNGIVGFTRGRIGAANSVDPQSRDLSLELSAGPFPPPFSTSIEGLTGNVSLTAVSTPLAAGASYGARMFGGQTLTYNVGNVPAGQALALLNLDLVALQPGLSGFPGIIPSPCVLSTSGNPVILGFETWFSVFLPPSLTGVVPLAIPHGWEGTTITAQVIGIDVLGGPNLIPWASNAIKYVAGLD